MERVGKVVEYDDTRRRGDGRVEDGKEGGEG